MVRTWIYFDVKPIEFEDRTNEQKCDKWLQGL